MGAAVVWFCGGVVTAVCAGVAVRSGSGEGGSSKEEAKEPETLYARKR